MLARLAGDVGLAVQPAEIFNDEYARMLERLREAVADGPTATAFELETMSRNNQLEGSSALFARLEQEVIALTECLREFQSTQGQSAEGSL